MSEVIRGLPLNSRQYGSAYVEDHGSFIVWYKNVLGRSGFCTYNTGEFLFKDTELNDKVKENARRI